MGNNQIDLIFFLFCKSVFHDDSIWPDENEKGPFGILGCIILRYYKKKFINRESIPTSLWHGIYVIWLLLEGMQGQITDAI